MNPESAGMESSAAPAAAAIVVPPLGAGTGDGVGLQAPPPAKPVKKPIGPDLPLFAIIASTICFAGGFAHLVHAQAWPSSDLEGHIATIDLYRAGLQEGTIWPYDHRSAFGSDGTPYYSWIYELILGFIALLLQTLGFAHAAAVTAIGTFAVAVAALPLTACWCAQQLAPADQSPETKSWIGHAGALAALTFLAGDSSDGYTGIGMGAVSIGLLNQCVGWNFLLLLIGAVGATWRRPDGWRIDLLVAGSTAALIHVHTMSALGGAIAVIPFVLVRPKTLVISGVTGVAAASATIMAVISLGDRMVPMVPWKWMSGYDPIMAVVGPALTRGGPLGHLLLPASVFAGVALLWCAWRALKTPGAPRSVAIAAIVLTCASSLAVGRMIMPGQSQPYRLGSLAFLLVLIAGAAMAPALRSALEARVRHWLLVSLLVVVWIGLLFQQVGSWPSEQEEIFPEAVLAEISPHLPAHSRLVVGDRIGWHRWVAEAWKHQADWETLNSIHVPVLPPTAGYGQTAAWSLGFAPQFFNWAPSLPVDQASKVLVDMGVTHLVTINVAEQVMVSDFESGAAMPESWAHVHTPHADIYTVSNTAPLLEPIRGGLIGIHLSQPRQTRQLLAEWWARIRARHEVVQRLVVVGDGPSASANVAIVSIPLMIDDRGGASGPGLVQVDLNQLPPFSCPQSLLQSSIPAISNAFYHDMEPAENRLSNLPAPSASVAAPGSFHWHSDHQGADFVGLTPGEPYLWRYAFSPGMRCEEGVLYEEASGFCVVIPGSDHLTISFSRDHGAVRFGLVVSLVMTGLMLGLAVAGRHRTGFSAMALRQPFARRSSPSVDRA